MEKCKILEALPIPSWLKPRKNTAHTLFVFAYTIDENIFTLYYSLLLSYEAQNETK